MRLGDLIPRVRKGYDEFEFHTIFHALNNFCSVDLSAVYLDILKDRLYTFRKDSPLRRGSQTVLVRYRGGPDEADGAGAEFHGGRNLADVAGVRSRDSKADSVHLAMFPEVDPVGRMRNWLHGGSSSLEVT